MKKLNPVLQEQEDALVSQFVLLSQMKIPVLIDRKMYLTGAITKRRFLLRLDKEGLHNVPVVLTHEKSSKELSMLVGVGYKAGNRKTIRAIHEFFERTNYSRHHK